MEGYFNQESKWAIVLIDKDNIDKMYTSTNEQPILDWLFTKLRANFCCF